MSGALARDFFACDTVRVARDLVGAELAVGRLRVRIVETEAYTTDAASHAVTRRHAASIMRETYGHVYVYRIYGLHYCLNFTTECDGIGAVLIRAGEPLTGIPKMSALRGFPDPKTSRIERLASGPGNLCRALGVDTTYHGEQIGKRIKVFAAPADPLQIICGPRIGIRRAVELPWRFYEAGNRFVSR